MTHSLLIHLNKHNIYNFVLNLNYNKITLPKIASFLELQPYTADAVSVISCDCGWKDEALNAQKRYLEVEGIAELDLYCPKCSQYLCFITEPVIATS